MNAMTAGRLAIQKILIDCISESFKVYGLPDWDVMEFANASFLKANKVVLVTCITASRVGFQGHDYKTVGTDPTLRRKDDWLEEQLWQIHCICKRGTPDAILPEDMSDILITWFNGLGCEYLRKKGVANVRIDFMNIFVYNDDSNLYQKRSVFPVKIQVPKEITTIGVEPMDMIKPEIQPI
jgi:hypothetical protein